MSLASEVASIEESEVNKKGLNGTTLLFRAVTGDRIDLVNLLIDKHADVNIADKEGYTPLIRACEKGYYEIAELLLKINSCNKDSFENWRGNTALMKSIYGKHIKIVQLLINNNVDVNIANKAGETPLIAACYMGSYDVVALLLRVDNINKDNFDQFGVNALMHAIKGNHPKIVQLLLKNNVDVNMADYEGTTALMNACNQGYEMVEMLMRVDNINKDAEDTEGITALSIAQSSGYERIIELLTSTQPSSSAEISKAMQYGQQEWKRSKIMIVGEGRAGKSALANSIIGKPFQSTESTVGMNQLTCSVNYAMTGGNGSTWGDYTKPEKELEAALALLIHSKPYRQQKSVEVCTATTVRAASTLAKSTDLLTVSITDTAVKLKISDEDEPVKAIVDSSARIVTNDVPVEAAMETHSFVVLHNNESSTEEVEEEEVEEFQIDETLVRNLASSIETNSNLIISVFDYGGQSVFNVIHHLFLTRNGVYVLVFNMEWLLSPGSQQFDQCMDYLRFWLNSIVVHTWNASSRTVAPIVLVGTRKDIIKDPMQHEHISTSLFETFSRTRAWPTVIRNNNGIGINGCTTLMFFPVDNTLSRQDPVVLDLLQVIEKSMDEAPYTHKQIPLSWLRVLDIMQATDRSNLSLSEALTISSRNGLSQQETIQLLTFLHDMGMIVWHNEANLRETVIMDPVAYFVVPATRIICKHCPQGDDHTHHYSAIQQECSAKYPEKWLDLIEQGVLEEQLLFVLWKEYSESQLNLITLLVRFGLFVPLHSDSSRNESGSTSQTIRSRKFLIPALLSKADLSKFVDWTDQPCQSCALVFTAFEDLESYHALAQNDLKQYGFLPGGLFERIIGKAVVWSQNTASEGTFVLRNYALHNNMAILSYGRQRFRLTMYSELNIIRVDIEGNNPIAVHERLLEQVKTVLSECMKLLCCFATLFYSDSGSETNAFDKFLDGGSNSDGLLIPLKILRSTISTGSVLSHRGGRRLLEQNQIKSRYGPWLQIYDLIDRYDVFISYRWGRFDDELVSGLFDTLTNYSIGQENRAIDVFFDKKRLKAGRMYDKDFVKALTSASVVVPIVSVDALKRLSQLNARDHDVDNVLLEWIIALECYAAQRIGAILPVVVGDRVEKEVTPESSDIFAIERFSHTDEIRRLSDIIPSATIEAAKRYLTELGLDGIIRAELFSKSVKQIVKELLKCIYFNASTVSFNSVVPSTAAKVFEVLSLTLECGVPAAATALSSPYPNVECCSPSPDPLEKLSDQIWNLLNDRNVKDLPAMKNLLADLGMEKGADVIYLKESHLDSIRSLLKPVQEGKLSALLMELRVKSNFQ